MNSQNPNPNEGQQPGTPSEGSTGQEPELPAAREQTGPENTEPESTEPESHAVPENPTPENPTEPLFPSPAADEPPHTSAGATPPLPEPMPGPRTVLPPMALPATAVPPSR